MNPFINVLKFVCVTSTLLGCVIYILYSVCY